MRIPNIYQSLDSKKGFIILTTLWLMVQVVLLSHFGIVTEFEAPKYINEANRLLSTGHYSTGNFLFYSVQILLITFSKITGTFPWLVVFVQMIANAISLVLFYKLCLAITKNHLQSFIVSLLLTVMFYYQSYNVHLFTESLYFSFGIIYSYVLFSIKKLSIKNSLLLAACLSVLYFTRPTGVFFIPSTILYLIFAFYRRQALLLILIFSVLGIASLYLLLNFALGSGGEFDFLLPYLDERVICGVPTISVPHNITVPTHKNSVEGLGYVITHHTHLFLSLASRRLIAFWGVIRPYHSFSHNVFVGLYFYATYVLILIRFKKLVQNFLPQTIFFLCNILLVMITVILSCDEWHNRFILALLPFLLLMAYSTLGAKSKPDNQYV